MPNLDFYHKPRIKILVEEDVDILVMLKAGLIKELS